MSSATPRDDINGDLADGGMIRRNMMETSRD